MPYDPPVFKDFDPQYPVDEVKLRELGQQYAAVAADIGNPATPVGAAVAAVAGGGGGGGGLVQDPADEGVFIVNNPGAISEDPSDEGVFVINGGGA